MDHKPLIGFLNINYHKNNFVRKVNKLPLLNICIKHIARKKNTIIDDLS